MKRSFGREEVVRNCFWIPRVRPARLRTCSPTRPHLVIPRMAGRGLGFASHHQSEFLLH